VILRVITTGRHTRALQAYCNLRLRMNERKDRRSGEKRKIKNIKELKKK
jgi:hypothetical protein